MTNQQKQTRLRVILAKYAFAFAEHTFLGTVKVTGVHGDVAHLSTGGICEIGKLSNIEVPAKRDDDLAEAIQDRLAKIIEQNPPSIPGGKNVVQAAVEGLIEQTRRPQ